MRYVQCTLAKGTSVQVAYIPKEFAVIDLVVNIRTSGKWSRGWNVVDASRFSVDESQLPDSHKDIKSHRRTTGDADPKESKQIPRSHA